MLLGLPILVRVTNNKNLSVVQFQATQASSIRTAAANTRTPQILPHFIALIAPTSLPFCLFKNCVTLLNTMSVAGIRKGNNGLTTVKYTIWF